MDNCLQRIGSSKRPYIRVSHKNIEGWSKEGNAARIPDKSEVQQSLVSDFEHNVDVKTLAVIKKSLFLLSSVDTIRHTSLALKHTSGRWDIKKASIQDWLPAASHSTFANVLGRMNFHHHGAKETFQTYREDLGVAEMTETSVEIVRSSKEPIKKFEFDK